jgi:murein DD-endopeptidase MepM/ murein hydrolase activator NlpD
VTRSTPFAWRAFSSVTTRSQRAGCIEVGCGDRSSVQCARCMTTRHTIFLTNESNPVVTTGSVSATVSAMTAVPCPRCGVSIGLHEGRPHIDVRGVVALYCAVCTPLADDASDAMKPSHDLESAAMPPASADPAAKKLRWLVAPVVASLAGAVLLSSWALAGSSGAASVASSTEISAEISIEDPLAGGHVAKVVADSTPQGPARAAAASSAAKWPMPVWDGVPMDEIYPSLRGWIHPVTDAKEIVPESGGRRFGAHRDGIMRSECGDGHCGVDLDGPRGQPLVSVAAGQVVRVEHNELGRDGRSGRYVRIEHDDGTLTAYMHMDDIAEGLEVGDHVDAGQYLGTLGATAIFASAPHCHFSLEFPLVIGTHGDNTQTRYIDPSPYLARSRIVPPLARRGSVARW